MRPPDLAAPSGVLMSLLIARSRAALPALALLVISTAPAAAQSGTRLLRTPSVSAQHFGFFSRDDKFAVENEGVAPDIDVENFPKDVIAGRDPQLERAVQEAMRLLSTWKNDRATKEPLPPVWGKRKP